MVKNLERKVSFRLRSDVYEDLVVLARLSGARDVSKYIRMMCENSVIKSQESIKERRKYLEDNKAYIYDSVAK